MTNSPPKTQVHICALQHGEQSYISMRNRNSDSDTFRYFSGEALGICRCQNKIWPNFNGIFILPEILKTIFELFLTYSCAWLAFPQVWKIAGRKTLFWFPFFFFCLILRILSQPGTPLLQEFHKKIAQLEYAISPAFFAHPPSHFQRVSQFSTFISFPPQFFSRLFLKDLGKFMPSKKSSVLAPKETHLSPINLKKQPNINATKKCPFELCVLKSYPPGMEFPRHCIITHDIST